MTYTTGTSTGSSEDESISTFAVPRTQFSYTFDVTAGIGVRHTQYSGREFTADAVTRETSSIQPLPEKISRLQRLPQFKKPVSVAAREHVARLLRECQTISHELCDSDDPIESALLGGQLTNSVLVYRGRGPIEAIVCKNKLDKSSRLGYCRVDESGQGIQRQT